MNLDRVALPLSLLLLTCGMANGQRNQAKLVGDLNQSPNLGFQSIPDPQVLTKVGGSYLVSAWTQDWGEELFLSQGTPQSTKLVKDIFPGTGSSSPRLLGRLGKLVFLIAGTPGKGREVWVTDGSSLGTRFFKELIPGLEGTKKEGQLASLVIGGKLFFLVETPGSKVQLWISDGKVQGTRLVKAWKVSPTQNSGGFDLQDLGGKLFFSFPDTPREAWISDGTTAGTRAILPSGQLDLWPSYPNTSVAFGGEAVFLAKNTKKDWGLYSSDGTAAGTKLRLPLGNGRLMESRLLALQNHVFLFTHFFKGFTFEKHLLSLDSKFKPQIVLDLGKKLGLAPLATFKSKALLTFYTDQKTSFSVLSDGSPKGSQVLIPSHNGFPDGVAHIVPTAQRVLFFKGRQAHPVVAWDPGLGRFQELPVGPRSSHFFEDGQRVLFSAVDPSLGGGSNLTVLWESDGRKQGTHKWNLGKGFFPTLGSAGLAVIPWEGDLVRILTPSQPDGRGLFEFRGVGNSLRSLGEAIGIPKMKSPWAIPSSFGPTFFGGMTQFETPFGVSDGTPQGTRIFQGVMAPMETSLQMPEEFDDRLFFNGTIKGTHPNNSILTSDGTLKGTKPLLDKTSPLILGFPFNLQRIGNRLGFFAWDAKGLAAYLTDGSSKGTHRMSLPSLPRKTTFYLKGFTSWAGRILFHYQAEISLNRQYLLLAMDTKGKTSVLHKEGLLSIEQLQRVGDRLFALRRVNFKKTRLDELKIVQGKLQFQTIQSFGELDAPELFRFQDRLFAFIPSNQRTKSFEIWANQGGSKPLSLIFKAPLPPTGPRQTKILFPLGSTKLLLQIQTDQAGWEPAVADLRTKTLLPLGDLYPGKTSSQAHGFRLTGGRLVFFATDPVHGEEPWIWAPGASGRVHGIGCSKGPLQVPSLELTDPILGAKLRAWGSGAPKNAPALLLLGQTAQPGTKLPGGSVQPCRLYLDLSRSWLPVQAFMTPGTATWSRNFSIPSDPSLIGLSALWQVVFPGQPGGFAVSNGYEATFGK